MSGDIIVTLPGVTLSGLALERGIVLTMSDAVINRSLQYRAALPFLLLLRERAGHRRMFSTLTCSLATELGCKSKNTIRNYRRYWAANGMIAYGPPDILTGEVTYYILEDVEPPSRQAVLEEQRKRDEQPSPVEGRKPEAKLPEPWTTPASITPFQQDKVRVQIEEILRQHAGKGVQNLGPIKTSKKGKEKDGLTGPVFQPPRPISKDTERFEAALVQFAATTGNPPPTKVLDFDALGAAVRAKQVRE